MKPEPISLPWFPEIRECVWARTPWARSRGLLKRNSFPAHQCMGFRFCNAVHTVGMRFSIDIAFVDRRGRLIRLYTNVQPGRWFIWGGFKAWTVYERESRLGNGS